MTSVKPIFWQKTTPLNYTKFSGNNSKRNFIPKKIGSGILASNPIIPYLYFDKTHQKSYFFINFPKYDFNPIK
jgi:hypothetical protein